MILDEYLNYLQEEELEEIGRGALMGAGAAIGASAGLAAKYAYCKKKHPNKVKQCMKTSVGIKPTFNIKEEEDIEERLAIFRKLSKLAKDPLGKKRLTTALRRHKKKLRKFRKSDYVEKAKKIKSRKDAPQLKKTMLANLKKGSGVSSLKRSSKELKRAKKSMTRRKRIRTGLALSGVGSAGFITTRRADIKGQSI